MNSQVFLTEWYDGYNGCLCALLLELSDSFHHTSKKYIYLFEDDENILPSPGLMSNSRVLALSIRLSETNLFVVVQRNDIFVVVPNNTRHVNNDV